MAIKLYHFNGSAESRAVLMTIQALGLNAEIIIIDLLKREQFNPEFIKINPQHCVPTLVDDGFVLWDSNVINIYLASKYENNNLYPKDLKKKAIVDHKLFFCVGTLLPKIDDIKEPILTMGEKIISKQKKDSLNAALKTLDGYLNGNKWVAESENYTIADITLFSNVSNLKATGWSFETFPNIQQWLQNCEDVIPGQEDNSKGAAFFGDFIKGLINPGEI